MKTEELIGDLLLQHSCVIIPSFGGFVTKRIGAKVDIDSGKMLPPSKSILFNIQLVQNDGLLINEIAQRKSISYDNANEQVNSEVLQWKEDLKIGKRIEIDKVGTLFLDAEKNLCFEQDRFSNLLLESFGLTTIKFLSKEDVQQAQKKIVEEVKIIPFEPVVSSDSHFATAKTTKEIPQKESQEAKKTEEATAPKRKRSHFWKYAAAACFLPVAFYSIWIPTQTQFLESGLISWRDFNPFYKQQTGVYASEKIALPEKEIFEIPSFEEQLSAVSNSNVATFPFQFDEDTYVLVRTETAKENTVLPTEEITSEAPISSVKTEIVPQKLEYIVGCFAQKSNAINLVQQLQKNGFSGRIVDVKNGLHRVSAGGAISMDKIQEVKQNASNSGYTGWILK